MTRYMELGHGLDPLPPGPLLPYPPVYRELPARLPVDGAFAPVAPYEGPWVAPLWVARWRWSGLPGLFDLFDANDDETVDEDELAHGLGRRGCLLLLGEASGPVDADEWATGEGSPEVFRAVDTDEDGRVTRRELVDALGPHAVRLAHGHPAHGPMLPAGAAYRWLGEVRRVVFPSREAKAAYMARAAIQDVEDPAVQRWARTFLRLPLADRPAAILRFCQACIRYERDPATFDAQGRRHGIELLDSSATGIHRGYGDCDLKARLFVALCLACGCRAKISPVFTGAEGFPHVQAKVFVDGGETSGARWELADPTIINSGIGDVPHHHMLTAFPRAPAEAAGPGPAWHFARAA